MLRVYIPALGIKIGPTPGLAVREPTGQALTQARQEVHSASAKGMPEKVLTTVSIPLKAKSSIPEPCIWHTQTHLPHMTHLLGS